MDNWVGAICGGSGFHPYECSHDRYCEHCTLAKTDLHNPENCALCSWLPDDHPDKVTELTHPLCKETFAINIRVKDYSHRYQKIKVRVDGYPINILQQELPL